MSRTATARGSTPRLPEHARTLWDETNMKGIVLNTQGGPQRDSEARVIGLDGEPIRNPYSADEFGGVTVCMYNAGCNVAERLIFGQIAGRNAAAEKDPLPAYEPLAEVPSDPAKVGDENDLVPDDQIVAVLSADGSITGYGTGMGGTFPVAVTFGDDGSVTFVEVGENGETQGIGSNAIDQMPERFAGVSSVDEAQAVDGVSGASMTSQALRDAVSMAIEAHGER